MASTSSSEKKTLKRPSLEKPIIGYVHNVSPEKRNRQQTRDYATFTLQTSPKQATECLLFSKHKRALFTESQTNRTPVKLTDYAWTQDQQKIVVNDMTFVSTPQPSEYSFQFAELEQPKHPQVSVLEILNSKKEWDMVSVQGKVGNKGENSTVGQKNLQLCEATFGDKTGTIPIDLWQSHIEQVVPATVYNLSAMQVRVWSGKKKITTTRSTVITPVKDDSLDSLVIDAIEVQPATSTRKLEEVSSLSKFERYHKCFKCLKKIPQSTCSRTLRCTKCGVVRADKCEVGFTITITAKTEDDQELTLRMGNAMLKEILGREVLNMDENEIADKLLFLDDFKCTYDSNGFIIANPLKSDA